MNAIHSSIDYVKELDDSLTQIMLVTDYNRDSMNQFAKSANEAAKAVSMTTTGMTNASLIFAQQGYDLNQSQELATLSAKLANASQQDTATTSDQITAYMNAYGLENSIGELTQAMDNWALIANVSAADVGELAQASQRAASMANAVGVNGEQLAAQIATIESVTREAPEQIGNGLKTLYARFSDISAGGEDENGFDLGKVTSQLQAIGVQIFDEMGQIRDVGDIMEDLMVIWDDLDQTSRVAASQALAGKYQVNRFMALMDNSDMYRDYLGATGTAATGTLDQMNQEYADSIEGRSAKLQASLEGLFSTIFNTDDIYPWMDAAQGAVDLLQQFFDALGGGKTVLLGISSLLMQIFGKNMAQEINNAATNRAVQQQKLENLQNSQAALTTLGAANPNPNDVNSQNILNFAQYMQANAKNFNAEQMNQANSILQELVQNSNAATMAADKLKDSLSVIGTGITATTGESILAPFLDSEGAVNATLLSEALQGMSQTEIADMFSHIQDDIKPARESLLEFNKALQDYQQELRNADSTDNTWNQSLDNLKATLLNLKDYIDPSTYERYEQAVNDIAEVTKNAGDKTAETTAEVAKLADGLEKVAAKDLTNLDQLNKNAFQAKNTQMAAKDSNKVAGAFKEGMGSQAQIQEILNTLNAVQQLTFAWQAFQSLGSLWANEDLSTGEKVLQTIMNLTMAMPQLISAMQTLQNNSLLSSVGQDLMTLLNPGGTNLGTFEILGQKVQEAMAAKEQLDELTEVAEKGKAISNVLNFDQGNTTPSVVKGMQEIAEKGKIAEKTLDAVGEELKESAMAGDAAEAALSSVSGVIGTAMATAAKEGATSLGILGAGLKAATAEAWAFITGPAAPFIIAGAAIAAIAVAIGAAQEQAKEAHEQAMADFEDAKAAQQQAEEFSTKINDWKSKRQENGDSKELAQEADELANSLREAGNAAEADALHLAAVKAEASGVTSDFDALEDAATRAQQAMSDQSALDTMEKANAILKDRLSTTEEIAAAQTALQGAALDYNLSQMSRTNGMEMGVLGIVGDKDLRAATMDWQSLKDILDQSVPGFAEITDENEKLALALSHTSDEAQRAAIEIQQILNANENLNGSARDTGGILGQRDSIVRDLENTGLNAEESLQLLVTVDDSSYETMTQDIQTVMKHLNNGEPFEVALKAIMDEQETEEYVKSQLAAYQPTDEDVKSEDFQTLSNMFLDNAGNMGEEGTEFEDYSEDLLNNASALEEVIEGILRYDDAVQSLDDSLDDWKEALADTNKFSTKHIEAVRDLQETYADFLDLSEDMDVSEEFAANADNLKLMEDAANGVEGAYEELANAAAEDILIHMDGIEDIEAARTALTNLTSELPSLFEGVDIGGALNLSSVKDQINDLATATGWSADQMAAYLNSIGINIDPSMFEPVNAGLDSITDTAAAMAGNVQGTVSDVANAIVNGLSYSADTEITSETGSKEDQIMYTNLRPVPGDTTTITSTFPVGNARGDSIEISTEQTTATVQGVKYEPEAVTASQVKEMTGYGLKSEVTNGPGGKGGVKLREGATASRGSHGSRPSGGARPSSGGGGGGGRSCFVAGTLITTDASFKSIEQIQKGDIVLSYNERLGLNEYSEVLQTMIHNTIEPIYTLYIKDEQLRVTGIHRFLVTNKITCGVPQWVHAADLRVGQWVLFADGTWHVIHKIEINIEHQIVYNFEVSHNHNYYVGRNQILAHNKGGGGGGGKKPKTIEPKEKKEHKKDYYEEVNSQLDKTEKILSRIEKEEDRLIGDKARANQNKQLSNLAKEIELQKEKQKIQQQELKDVDALMRKRTREAQKIAINSGVGAAIPTAVYDEDGVIANYEQMSAAIDNVHNKLIDKYNAAAKAGNEELAKEIQKTIEKFDKYGEDLLSNAQRHNELQSEIEETTNALEELEDAMEDIRIEAFKAHQEAIDDLKDLREGAAELASLFRDFDEDGFLTGWSLDDTPIGDMVEAMYELDNIYTVTQEDANAFYQDIINKKRQDLANTTDADERAAIQSAISYFQGQQANLSSTDTLQNGLLGLANQDLDMLRGWIEGTNSEPNPFGENEAALWEAYQEAYDRSIELFKDWRETVRDLRDSIIDAYDEQEEAIEQHIDEYDRLLDHLERMNDTYSLYYGEDSYDGILAIMDQQGSTMQQQLNSLTTAYNYWQEQYEAAVANGDEKLIQEIRKKMEDAEDAMYDKAEELAEHWVERYETAVDASIQKVDFQLWGGGPGQMDFEDQTMIWELQKDYISTYKDDVERAYEVDKLRSKYINLLNDAQGMSLQIQNKIRGQMQEQLDLLQNQGTMSEYDVKLANAKLEILQKQIALEDAQRNKNKMQLRRDTQGNYRYVYTANQGDVQKAQDELNESQYDAYEMTKEQTIANNDRAVSLYQDYMEKLRNIANKYKDDEVARAAALKALNEEYSKLLGALEEDFKDTTNGMYDVLTWMVENGTQDTATAAMDMLDQLYDKNGEVKENTGNDWRDFATHITTDVLPNVEKAVQEGIADINAEAFDLQTNMVGDDGVLTKIGSSVDTLGTSLDSIVEKTDSWTQAVTDLFNAFFADDRGIQNAMSQLEAMEQQLSENQTATSALSTRYNEANSALQASQAESQHYQTALDFATGARSVREGTIVKLKKGTRVHYDRYGGKQQDEEGHTSWKLPKDMWVKFAKPISGVPLPYPFYATGESLKSFGGLKTPHLISAQEKLKQIIDIINIGDLTSKNYRKMF